MRRAMLLCAALGLIGCHDGEEGADPVRSESFELDVDIRESAQLLVESRGAELRLRLTLSRGFGVAKDSITLAGNGGPAGSGGPLRRRAGLPRARAAPAGHSAPGLGLPHRLLWQECLVRRPGAQPASAQHLRAEGGVRAAKQISRGVGADATPLAVLRGAHGYPKHEGR